VGVHISSRARCALKVDKPGPRGADALKWESDILGALQRFPFVPRKYGYFPVPGKTLSEASVLAMNLLGPNVSALRRTQPGGQLPLASCLGIGLQMLTAAEGLHAIGYIHRDIKPSNFVVADDFASAAASAAHSTAAALSPRAASSSSSSSSSSSLSAEGGGPSRGSSAGRKQRLIMLDFGQSRQYLFPGTMDVRPARPTAEFRGTSLYSSLHAHLLQDLGRRDDLWSVFYCIVDMVRGGIPWRPWKEDRKRCQALKEYYMAHPGELTAGLPGESHLAAFEAHLATLAFESKPDYALLALCLRSALAEAERDGTHVSRPKPSYAATQALRDLIRGFPRPGELIPGLDLSMVEAWNGGGGSGTAGNNHNSSGSGEMEDGELVARPHATATSPTSSSFSSSSDYEVHHIHRFDVANVHQSCDPFLHSRGGAWPDLRDPAYRGVNLRYALAVDADGSPAPEAVAVDEKLAAYARLRREVLAGWEAEEEAAEVTEEAGSAGAESAGAGPSSDSPTVPPRLPAWLTSRRRGPPEVILPAYASSTPSSVVSFARRRLAELSDSLVWGASLAEASSSAAASTGASPIDPALAAAVEYLSAWAGLASAVATTPAIAAFRREESVPADVQRAIRALLAAAANPAETPLPPHIDPDGPEAASFDAQRLRACEAAAAGAALIRASPQLVAVLGPVTTSSAPAVAALGRGVAGGVALRVSRALAALESWLAACGAKLPAAAGFASLGISGIGVGESAAAAELASAAGAAGPGGNGGGAVLREPTEEEERRMRHAARSDLNEYRQLVRSIARERALHVPSTAPSTGRRGGERAALAALSTLAPQPSEAAPFPESTGAAGSGRKRSRWGDPYAGAGAGAGGSTHGEGAIMDAGTIAAAVFAAAATAAALSSQGSVVAGPGENGGGEEDGEEEMEIE
jgi:serine/threonine protein kinase